MQIRHGEGVYTFAKLSTEESEVVYKGAWENNEKHGIGQQNYPGVGDYYGYWENGQRHGEGVMTYANKDVYSGQWANGNKHGKGTYIFFLTAQKYVGQFVKGQMVSGRWNYPNGSYFEGNFDNNKPKGAGCWNFANGNQVQGCYKQSVKADVAPGEDEHKLAWTTTGDITA